MIVMLLYGIQYENPNYIKSQMWFSKNMCFYNGSQFMGILVDDLVEHDHITFEHITFDIQKFVLLM